MKDYFRTWASILALALLLLTSSTGWGAATGEQGLYIVVLKQPSLAEKLVGETPGMSWADRRKMLSDGPSSDYRKALATRQEDFLRAAPSALRRSGGSAPESLEVTHRTTLLLNSLLVRMTSDEARRMALMEGVRGVYPNGRVGMAMDAVPRFLGAPEVWEQLGGSSLAGAGVRIGIVDSGIDISHPMFQDSSLTPPVPALPGPTGFEAFTNEKVIAARNYVLREYGLNNEDTAEDLVGHGSIVASIAAGTPVDAPLGHVSGIAPRAYLGSYRVFGDPSRNRFATDGALIAAVEQAVEDGMDVINMSLGGPARDPNEDPTQEAVAEAVELGVVVVIASGNGGGSGAGSVMSPGTSPAAITVGSVSHPRVFGSPLQISSADTDLTVPEELTRFLQVPGLRTPTSQRFGPLPIVSIQSFDASGRACDPLPAGSLTGKLALVRRGVCFFSVKADHVLNQAGAAGMVVYNDVGGAPFAMDLGEATLSKPAVMIDLEHGERLRQLLLEAAQSGEGEAFQAWIGSQDDTSPFPGEPDLLLNFSGRGPTGRLGIKPDLVAPGQTLYAAAIGSSVEGGFAFTNPESTSGTSFSTPMVSGAAALLVQLHPDWTPGRIKSALVHYSSRSVLFNGRAALPTEAGGGRLDVAKAAAAEVLARVLEDGTPIPSVNLEFGTLAEENGGERALVLELRNVGAAAKDLTIGLENQAQIATISWEPTHLHLEPGAIGSVTISARLSGSPGNFEGFVRVRDSLGGPGLAIPYFGVATVRGQGRTLRVSSEGDVASPSDALNIALPGDVIEIATDAEYATPLEISRNLFGVKLDGLTIRAAPGFHPVINALLGGDTLDRAVIRVLGLERVTIEGLTIRSRSLGIEYIDSSGTVGFNQILMEGAEGELPDAIRLENSRVHLYGNMIVGSNRDGISLEDSAILAQANSVDSSRRHGFFLSDAAGVALFDNWVHESRGDGVLSVESQLLAKGNLISGGATSEGDGVRLEGPSSRVLLRDNSISRSGRSGLALVGGAEASSLGDDISLNNESGLFLNGSTAHIESARLFANATAIQATSGELDLQNSLLADSETGSGLVMDGGALLVDHATIANNAGSGMELGALSRLEVTNSILHGNGAGDVQGGSEGVFHFNLFQGAAREGVGNRSGDARFINAAARDFTPGSGSAAIDGGDPEQPEGLSDLYFHQRTVDGDADGQARTDIGAIEANSRNAPPIILPILTSAPDNFIGLAMVNAYTPGSLQEQQSIVSSSIRMQAFDTQGRPQAYSYESEILPGRQLAVLLEANDVLGPLRDGWVEILPSVRDLTAFSLVGNSALSFLDGAQLTSNPSRRLLFPEVRGNGENTWIYLVNPHREAGVLVRLIWTRSGGSETEVSLPLPPMGMISSTFHDLFGVGDGGYLVAEASPLPGSPSNDLPVFGLELFGDATNRRAGLLAIDLDRGDKNLFGAQLASTSQIETTVHVINLGHENAQVVLTAHGENGAALVATSRILAAGGELRLDARDLFGFDGDVVGWIEVHSGQPVAGSVTFGDPGGRFLASLPLQPQGAREFFLSHVAQTDQIFTGLTLLNAGDETALVSLEVFSATGALRGTAFLELKPGVKTARLLSELLNDSFTQAGGFIRVRSNQPVFGFELFGARTLEYLSAVPPQISVY